MPAFGLNVNLLLCLLLTLSSFRKHLVHLSTCQLVNFLTCQYELFSLSLPTKQTKELMATVDDKKIIFSMVGVSKVSLR